MAIGCDDTSIAILDTRSGRRVRSTEATGTETMSLAFSPDGSRLSSGGRDHAVRVWAVATGALLLLDQDLEGDVTSTAWSPDVRWLAAGNSTGIVILRYSPNPSPAAAGGDADQPPTASDLLHE